MKAIWKGVLVAESDATEVVEGNHYFPKESVDASLLSPSTTTSACPWKGTASYLNITVAGETNTDAAWFYADPLPGAEQVADRVAFWKGVEVTP